MATFSISILKHQEREDEKFPVSIRITQNRQSTYLKTGFYVSRSQLNKDFSLKDKDLIRVMLNQIHEYENMLTDHVGGNAVTYSAKDIKNFIEKKIEAPSRIDFILFAREHIASLLTAGKTRRALHIQSVINSFEDCFGNTFDIRELKSETLTKYEKHLRSTRIIYRLNQKKEMKKREHKPMTDTGVHDYLSDIRYIFNQAKDKYNDEDSGVIVIQHNPFKKYEICSIEPSENRDISIDAIRKIASAELSKTNSFARDVFMLSFFLVGINTIDLYNVHNGSIEDGRLSYNRSKTKGRRRDRAFISIKIEPEAEELINKYRDPTNEYLFYFHKKYANSDGFNIAVNKALENISKELELNKKITFYSARHSWATIAHNTLGYTQYDIAECLNHVINSLKTTSGYIRQDFSRIDKINGEMLQLFKVR